MRRMKSESLIFKERKENSFIDSVVELNISLYTKISISLKLDELIESIFEFKVNGNGLYQYENGGFQMYYEDGICSIEIDRTDEGVLEAEIYGVK